MVEWGGAQPNVVNPNEAAPASSDWLRRLGGGLVHAAQVVYDRLSTPRSDHQLFVDRMAQAGVYDVALPAFVDYAGRGERYS